ncbi:hypothetical protein DDE18_11330 [Nocardioides gansuensis]|uniref:Thymidylate kinase n=1 Tax=Nocardioides gansuensis TaxID=2138300 RepID=A0A2T8FB28_9ACTN|nr:hypothetical protein [Nocardioides gansuensis]PVG82928.1 hypothetical protein DDE18_11330 [Nocardioides gansuensis]
MTIAEAHGASTAPGIESLGVLHGHGLSYAVLRPPHGAGDDLDVLVAADDLEPALGLLRSRGLVEEPAFGRGTHRFLVGLEGGSFVRLDLVTSLDFGPLSVWSSGMAQACLARAAASAEDVPRLDPRDEFWVTLLHLLADDGTEPRGSHRLVRLAGLAEAVAEDPVEAWHRVVSPLLPRSVSPLDVVRTCARHDSSALAEALWTLRPGVRRRCLREVLDAGAARPIVSLVMLRATERLRQWRGRRGLLVAVLGPDGAGKSTLLEAIGRAWPWPHERIYFGLWPDAYGSSAVVKTLWPLRRPLRAVRRYGIGWLGGARGRLVLFDRYVYDAAAPPRGRLQGLKRLYFGILLRCVPAPDVAVLLEAPGEVLYARKGEMSPQVLDDNRDAIARHVQAVHRRTGRPRVLVVDATQRPSAVADEVVAAIWGMAAERLQGKNTGGKP